MAAAAAAAELRSPVAANPRWQLLLTLADSRARCLPLTRPSALALAEQQGLVHCRRRPPGLKDRVLAKRYR